MKRLLSLCMAFMIGITCVAFICGNEQRMEAKETSCAQNEGREIRSGSQKTMPEEYEIEDFRIVKQMPELPTGCEITALTMMINFYGYDVSKTVMASEYLPVRPAKFYYGADGKKYGYDLDRYFIGDPWTSHGYICGTEAIVTAADKYLEETGSSLRALDLSGEEPEHLYELVENNVPVMVWVTIGMKERRETQGWYTESGKYVEWSSNDHGAVLIGYDRDDAIIADPISGLCRYPREQFEHVFETRGRQCVILEEKGTL